MTMVYNTVQPPPVSCSEIIYGWGGNDRDNGEVGTGGGRGGERGGEWWREGQAMWCQVAEVDRSDNAYDLRFKRDFCIPCAYTVP